MDITAFIRELLFSHDCVILPGFGGFVGNYTPARIDKDTDTFYPPVKQISFNRNLNHNDGLLIGRISGSSEINYGDARNMADEFVASLRKKLERGEKVRFDKIGTFTNNREGNVQFEPDHDVNYHLGSYGLDSFQFSPLEGYDVRKRITGNKDRAPMKRASMRKILWRAAIIIPVLAVLTAIPLTTDIFRSKVETTTMNPLVTAEFENNKKAVDEEKPAKAEEIIITEKQNTPPVIKTATPLFKEEMHFCLITGSFKVKQNAYNQADVLRKEGYNPEILDAPNGFYRVSAVRCRDILSARNKADSISKNFPGTWVKKI
jgi:nucleoid DNA-binding protein